MMIALLSLLVIFVVLVTSEILWRQDILRGEVSRKAVHITVGTFIATWPFFMPFSTIQRLSLALLLVVTVSKSLRLFQSVHAVPRQTIGELLFPIGIGLSAGLTDSPWVFAAAIAHMSLADGMAAMAGTAYLYKHKLASGYRILGQIKTVPGSSAFFITSLAITVSIVALSPLTLTLALAPLIFALALSATALENLGVYGSDNLLVPLLVIMTLNTVL